MNSYEYHEGVRPRRWFKVIRGELLRLAKAEFELMLALQDRLGVQDEYAVVAKGWQKRAEKADAELAALKARIADSAHVDVTLGCAIDGEIPPDLALCKVALVRVEE